MSFWKPGKKRRTRIEEWNKAQGGDPLPPWPDTKLLKQMREAQQTWWAASHEYDTWKARQ